jgi:hypothetical protein
VLGLNLAGLGWLPKADILPRFCTYPPGMVLRSGVLTR